MSVMIATSLDIDGTRRGIWAVLPDIRPRVGGTTFPKSRVRVG